MTRTRRPRQTGHYPTVDTDSASLSKRQAWAVAIVASLMAPVFVLYLTGSFVRGFGVWIAMLLCLGVVYTAAIRGWNVREIRFRLSAAVVVAAATALIIVFI